MSDEARFETFRDFYPFYLSEHRHPVNRSLHFIGTLGVIAVVIDAAITGNPWLLLLVPVVGYGFAWAGHFFVEKNRPATFTYPLWSLMGDWVMFWQILTGRLRR